VGKILTVPNIILTPPGARNVSARMAGLPWGPDYIEKIQGMFGTDLIGFYVGDEPPGSAAAVDYSPFGYHGAYTSVKLGQQGRDGRTCPLYDGATSYMQPPAGFRAALNNQELTVAILGQFTASVWADGATRRLISFRADANNWVTLAKAVGAGALGANYIAGGTNKTVSVTTGSPITFFSFVMTVSKSSDQMKVFFGGAQSGLTQTGLGVWSGPLLATDTLIGAQTTVPTLVMNGLLASCIVLARAATPAEVAQVSEG